MDTKAVKRNLKKGRRNVEEGVSNVESGEENIVFLSDPAAEIVDVDDGPGGGEARPAGGSSKTTAASVVLTSTGPSAEYRGNFLGVFDRPPKEPYDYNYNHQVCQMAF